MSIRDVIADRCRRRMLFPLLPHAPGAAAERAMFVSEGLWQFMQSPSPDQAWDERVGELQADLERFVTGDPIDPKYLFLLSPTSDAVWEIRSTRPKPSIRVLGLFAAKDVFVATNFALRSELGGWQSREWKAAKRAAKARWRHLLSPYQPLGATNYTELVSGAIDGRYFR